MTNENIEQMKARHRAEVEALQASCEHKQVSDWEEYRWAPGLSPGVWARVCGHCGIVREHEHLPIIREGYGNESVVFVASGASHKRPAVRRKELEHD